MKNVSKITASLYICLFLLACGGTEIDKNPQPIVWGTVKFAPATIEKSGSQTVWNNVVVTGEKMRGKIDKVTIKADETIVENLDMEDISAKKQIFRGASGDYRGAVENMFSGNPGYDKNLSSLPQFNLKSYEGEDVQFSDVASSVSFGAIQGKNISFQSISDLKGSAIIISPKNEPQINIASASLDRMELPANLDSMEDIIINDFTLKDIKIPERLINVKSAEASYSRDKLNFDIANLSFPGALLAEEGLPNLPETIHASLKGDGSLAQNNLTARADLDVADLLNLKADIHSSLALLKRKGAETVNFTLKDQGLLSRLSGDDKTKLLMASMFIPGGQEAIFGFLSKPGQTLSGTINMRSGVPSISLKLN